MSFLNRLFGGSKKAETDEKPTPQAPSIVDVFNTSEFFRLEKEGLPIGGAESGFRYIVQGNNRVFVASAKERIEAERSNLKPQVECIQHTTKQGGQAISDFTEKLYEAAIRGNVKEIQKLLNSGANVNASLRQNGTALHGAAIFGKTEVIKLLLAKGADVNAMDCHGNTPLERAVYYISEYSNKETVELLRRHGGILKGQHAADASGPKSAKPEAAAPAPPVMSQSPAKARPASPQIPTDKTASGGIVEVKLASNDEIRARQLILRYAKGSCAEPKFGILMLPGEIGLSVNLQTHAASFIKMSGESAPFFVVRCDKELDQFRTCPLVLAFSFCRFKAGGMVLMFVGVDLPGEDTPWGGLVEANVPLDSAIQGQVELMEKGFRLDRLHMCFAKGGASSGTYITSDGAKLSYKMPECQFDRVLAIPKQASAVLAAEYNALKGYHMALPSSKRSGQACMAEANKTFPSGQHPIIGYRFV